MRADPVAVTAGKRATFSVIAENTGNTVIAGRFDGDDPESQVAFGFDPDDRAPRAGRARDRGHAGRGQAASRRLAADAAAVRVPRRPAEPTRSSATRRARPPAHAANPRSCRRATFVQKSVLSRGSLSLVGLLVAVTVFAIVITLALAASSGRAPPTATSPCRSPPPSNGGGAQTGTSSLRHGPAADDRQAPGGGVGQRVRRRRHQQAARDDRDRQGGNYAVRSLAPASTRSASSGPASCSSGTRPRRATRTRPASSSRPASRRTD